MFEKVQMIISQYSGVKKDKLKRETDLVKELELTSLDVVNLVVEFEDALDIDIPNSDIRKFRYLQDIVDYLEARV
ncbi:MAG TPA: acyl carrier protein [Clostridiaceae bacterium]|nr:acyl carrier protein [Clostridiaceae bacterium]